MHLVKTPVFTLVMINRVLIRLKIIQIVYAYYQNGSKNLDAAEKELFFSLSKAYDLYNYLLMLMIALTNYAQKRIDAAKAKLAPTAEELYPNMKFVENKFISQLEVNRQLMDFISNQKRTWENDEDFVKGLFEKIVASDIYKAVSYTHLVLWPTELKRRGWVSYLHRAATTNYRCCDQALEDSKGAGRIGLTRFASAKVDKNFKSAIPSPNFFQL